MATVTWIGYQAPQPVLGGWNPLGNPFSSDSVVHDDLSRTGGADLAEFYRVIDASRGTDPHLTALGHSYGSTTTGFALQERTGVDDAVFFGSPGLGTSHIEEMSATYEQMQTRLRDRLSAEVRPLRWVNDQNAGAAGCADFSGVGGRSRTLDRWTAEGNLPDARWDRAVRIVAEVTGEYGFGAPETVVDRPGDHDITATDPYGGGYQFGTARSTVLMVSTGCHLPADRHPSSG